MEEEIRRRKEGVPSVKTKREAAEGGRRHAEGVKAKFEWGGGMFARRCARVLMETGR